MNAKERVKVAMELGQPDRVPVLPAMWVDHAASSMGVKFVDVLKNPWLGYEVMEKAARKYGFDGVRTWLAPAKGWDENIKFVEKDGKMWVIDKRTEKPTARIDMEGGGGLIPMNQEIAIKGKEDLKKIKILDHTDYECNGQLDPVKKFVNRVKDDFFVVGLAGGQSLNYLAAMRGNQQALLDLYDNPQFARKIMEIGTQISIEIGIALIKAGVDAIYIGDAFASCSVISPEQYRKFCFPLHRKAAETFHKYGVKVYLHICGNSSPILEMMADTRVDAIEPLDPLGGVDLAEAKRRVGNKVCLMGGLNTLTLLQGKPKDVEREAKECIEKAAERGGYILGSGDAIPKDSPPSNVKAMVNSAIKYGDY